VAIGRIKEKKMIDFNTELDALVAPFRVIKGLTLNEKDSAAYNQDLADFIVQTRCGELEQDASGLDMQTISRQNLMALLKKTKATVAAALKKHGEEKVLEVINAAKEACDVSCVSLTHDPNWEDTGYGNEDSLDNILKSKKLIAPYYRDRTQSNEQDSVIYCGMVYNKTALESSQNPYFLIRELSPDLLERSTTVLDTESGMFAVGGNHFVPAWQLATILYSLDPMCLKQDLESDTIVKNIREAASLSLGEIMIPRELDLVGHALIHDGEEEKIKASRAKKKPPQKKRDPLEKDGTGFSMG
jgi:hypothetical protein